MKRTLTFSNKKSKNSSVFKKNLAKSSNIKVKEYQLTSNLEIRKFRLTLRNNLELLKEPNLIQLILYIKTLNGINPLNMNSSYYMKEETKSEALIILKKIIELLRQINIFLFYFKHYRIDEKIILKIIPNLRYSFYQKNELIFKEGDISNKFYFLIKGKVSFKKKIILLSEHEPKFIEKQVLEEGSHFGDWDIIYDRKKKTSAFCVENCHIISVDRDTFKDYFELKIIKTEGEVKSMLKNFLMENMTLPAIKIERFIQNNIKTLFFKRNEVIYKEGDNNSFLYMINRGEANLIQKFSKGEYSFLLKYQYSLEYVKNMAKRIDYKGVIRNAHLQNDNYNFYNYYSEDKDKENSNDENEHNIKTVSNKDNKNDSDESVDSSRLDLLLEKNNYQVISSLVKGSLGGLEICTGITKLKYSLISNSDFTSVFKIDLKQLDGEHLTEFMLNLIPTFIKLEKKIHLQIKKMRFIDSNIIPPSCQKFHQRNHTVDYYYKDEENDDVYKRDIQKLDSMFQTNEGGFIRMNDYNMKLHKKKNALKELLKENLRKDRKTDIFLKTYVNAQNSKLKFRGMKKIKPVIPNYDIIDNRYDNLDNKKNNDEIEDTKLHGIFYSFSNGKNNYYLIDKKLLLGKNGNKSKNKSRNNFYSKKSQEMFDKLFPKARFSKYNLYNKKMMTLDLHKFKNKNFNYKKYFIDNNNYMRELFIQRNKNTIHCFDKNSVKTKFSKSVQKINNYNDKMFTLNNYIDTRKMKFFDTGKYDIPLLTEMDSFSGDQM